MIAQTIQQQRAAHALAHVEGFAGARDHAKAKEYANAVKELPALIVALGLGQAVATEFARAKGNAASPVVEVLFALARWLGDPDPGRDGAPYAEAKIYEHTPKDEAVRRLLTQITKRDQNAYVIAQGEALAYLEWLKPLAVGYLSPIIDANETEGAE